MIQYVWVQLACCTTYSVHTDKDLLQMFRKLLIQGDEKRIINNNVNLFTIEELQDNKNCIKQFAILLSFNVQYTHVLTHLCGLCA